MDPDPEHSSRASNGVIYVKLWYLLYIYTVTFAIKVYVKNVRKSINVYMHLTYRKIWKN